jgi:hypothetical protein
MRSIAAKQIAAQADDVGGRLAYLTALTIATSLVFVWVGLCAI